jgi:hypothetical protein
MTKDFLLSGSGDDKAIIYKKNCFTPFTELQGHTDTIQMARFNFN